MQAHLEDFSFSKNCNFYPFRFYYIKTWEKCSLLLPSHNCIIIHNVQFSRCIWISSVKRLNEASCFQGTSVTLFWWRLAGSNRWPPACKAGALPAELNPHIHLFWFWSGGPKWTRFSAEKPRRLQQSTGLLPSAGFRVLSATQTPSLVRILCPFLWSGGPKWTRTIDLTIISRVL